MDFLTGKVKNIYFKYLGAAFGSALITSIYSIVDMAMVGQYAGPEGSAALAVVMPVWNIIYSIGLLMGIGGSVLFSALRGQGQEKFRQSNEYFTASVIGSIVLAVLVWVAIAFFDEALLRFFGASESLLPLAREYVAPIKFAVPLFLFNQMLAAYLRNDKNPGLATAAVLAGGIFNIFGDYFFVFPCGMGVYGAGLATAIGSGITFLVMLTHFFRKKNTLRLMRPKGLLRKLREICVTGFATFFIDVAMGILTILFNRQILALLGADVLEMGSRATLAETGDGESAIGESGGFLQVSGLRYTIDTSVESTVEVDEAGMFVSCGEERRVRDVQVLQEDGSYAPIDAAETYTVASHSYLIKEGGDGLNMFWDNTLTIDGGMMDYEILITYLEDILGGTIGEEYATPQGRINVV